MDNQPILIYSNCKGTLKLFGLLLDKPKKDNKGKWYKIKSSVLAIYLHASTSFLLYLKIGMA